MVDLDDEGDAVDVTPRNHSQGSERRGHGIALPRQGQLNDVGRIEVLRGFLEKLAAAECSIPWSTGRMEMYPVPARRPWLNNVPRLRSTVGERSLSVKTLLR